MVNLLFCCWGVPLQFETTGPQTHHFPRSVCRALDVPKKPCQAMTLCVGDSFQQSWFRMKLSLDMRIPYCNRRFGDVFLHFLGETYLGMNMTFYIILECNHRFKLSYWRFAFFKGTQFNMFGILWSYFMFFFPGVGWFNHVSFLKSFLTKLTPWYLTPWYSQIY